jgi:hypothetical protein
MERADPYLVLLRRELVRAQARLRRCERERDALRTALEALKAKKRGHKNKMRFRITK